MRTCENDPGFKSFCGSCILSKGPINYLSQTKEDSIYPERLHTNKIVQTKSSPQMSMFTSNYDTH